MEALVDIAKNRGLPGVSAVIMSDNLASLHIFYSLGYAVTGTVERGVTEIKVHFDRPVTEPTVELDYEGREHRQP
jgi:L-amino acid N-acyltransferase YncA